MKNAVNYILALTLSSTGMIPFVLASIPVKPYTLILVVISSFSLFCSIWNMIWGFTGIPARTKGILPVELRVGTRI